MKRILITITAVTAMLVTFFAFTGAQAAENQITLNVSQASGLIFADYTAQESALAGIALYSPSGQLSDVRLGHGSAQLQLPLPETLEGYKVKAFLWNSDQEPLVPEKEISLGYLEKMSDYPAAGVVDFLEKVDDETIIHFSTTHQMEQTMKIRKDATYEFILNGEKIEPSELTSKDTLAVCYDSNGSFLESSSYKILVTRQTIYGKILSYDQNNGYFVDNGRYYKPIDPTQQLEIGMGYELFVDAFGRIITQDQSIEQREYWILENVYLAPDQETYAAQLISPDDGTTHLIPFQSKVTSSTVKEYMDMCYESDGVTKKAIVERVVEYKISTSNDYNEIVSMTPIPASATAVLEEYNQNTKKIGAIRINEKTKILDASAYEQNKKYLSLSLNDFVDGSSYTAIGFNKVDNVYSFVIILEGALNYTVTTPVSIYSNTVKQYDSVTDQEVDCLAVYTENENNATTEQYFMVADYYTLPTMSEGDVIVYRLNQNGYVDDVQIIFDTDLSSYSNFRSEVSSHLTVNDVADPTFSNWLKPIDKWIKSQTSYDKNGIAEVFFGPVVNKTNDSISIGKVTVADGNEITLESDLVDSSLNPNANVYVYDFNNKAGNRLSKSIAADIIATNIPESTKLPDKNNDKTTINWSDPQVTNGINYVFFKTIDGDITDAYIILAPRQ